MKCHRARLSPGRRSAPSGRVPGPRLPRWDFPTLRPRADAPPPRPTPPGTPSACHVRSKAGCTPPSADGRTSGRATTGLGPRRVRTVGKLERVPGSGAAARGEKGHGRGREGRRAQPGFRRAPLPAAPGGPPPRPRARPCGVAQHGRRPAVCSGRGVIPGARAPENLTPSALGRSSSVRSRVQVMALIFILTFKKYFGLFPDASWLDLPWPLPDPAFFLLTGPTPFTAPPEHVCGQAGVPKPF